MTVTADMIDISADQHGNGEPIDWTQPRRYGVTKVVVKATEGLQYVNPWLVGDARGAAKNGLEVAYYHFAHPGLNSPYAEVAFLMSHIQGLPRSFGVMLDLEVTEGLSWPVLAHWAQEFLSHLPRSVVNRSLYSNGNFLDNMPEAPWGHHLIYAWPGVNGAPNSAPAPNRPCWAWQFSWTGTVPGVVGAVDLCHFYGTS